MRTIPALLVITSLAAGGVLGAAPSHRLVSGLDLASFDHSVRPQDDLFRFVNGKWLDRTEIPAERVVYTAAAVLEDKTTRDLQRLMEEVAAIERPRRGSIEQQVGDLYRSLMDEAWIEALGRAPIQPVLDRINAATTANEFAAVAGYVSSIGAGGPFGSSMATDPADASKIAISLEQSGIMLPDRDYYLTDQEPFIGIRTAYEGYLSTILGLAGRPDPAADATAVLALEARLAEVQWSRAMSRNPSLTINRFTLDDLTDTMPGFDWKAWARPQGIDKVGVLILTQPSFFSSFASLMTFVPIETWKAWLISRFVTARAPFLSHAFGAARFEFFGRRLTGQEQPITRWKRGVSLVNGYVGEALGRLYVERHFPASSRDRAERITKNVIAAFERTLRDSRWLSDSTRAEALEKLGQLEYKIGFPRRWRSYRGLEIRRDDLLGNIERAQTHETQFRARFLQRPGRSGAWMLPPQSVNAYYSPATHEIVFPAGILQPPYFNVEADDAVNYGAIGAVIGHEIGHSLDTRGRQLDSDGRVRDWWTDDDDAEYRQRTARLVEQFDAYKPRPGLAVRGRLTLSENFGDLSGLAVAYRAYQMSLDGKRAPDIDGFTGEQRFFLGWAQIWRGKIRDEYLRQFLISTPHAPPEFRTNGTVSNMPAFYEAFAVQMGDRLYRPPDDRVRIW